MCAKEKLYHAITTVKIFPDEDGLYRFPLSWWQEVAYRAGNEIEPWEDNGLPTNIRIEAQRKSTCVMLKITHHGSDKQVRLKKSHFYAYERHIASLVGRIRELVYAGFVKQGIRPTMFDKYSTIYAIADDTDSSYRVKSDIGDIVRMPCGTIAVVNDVRFDVGGNAKIITLVPICGIWKHIWLFWTGKLDFANEEIDELEKVGEMPITR